jgi:hypothetical protein
MFDKVSDFIKIHQGEIILLIGVVLISLLSFAAGFIFSKYQEKAQLKFEPAGKTVIFLAINK